MKTILRQSGSAHVVIIIVLVVALLGLLGFVFWQNFINKDTATQGTNDTVATTDSDKDVATDDYAGWSTYKSDNGGYSFKYPADWILVKETNQDGPYVRNFDPTSKQPAGGYPEGYINVRVLYEADSADFKARTDYTTTEWYDALGKTQIQDGAVGYLPAEVKDTTVNGLPAKSAKSVFTETNENIYFLKGTTLYFFNLYPYGASSDPTVKLIIDSLTFNS
ncbi:MAG: PsbP-related protein [Candidatus Microsaccharimonas sp.]